MSEHDPSRPVGKMEHDGTIQFKEWAPDSMMPVGLDFVVLEQEMRDGVRYIKKVRLLGISLLPPP